MTEQCDAESLTAEGFFYSEKLQNEFISHVVQIFLNTAAETGLCFLRN